MGLFDTWSLKPVVHITQPQGFPGLPIEGFVSLKCEKEVECRGLFLEFRCDERTHWSSGSGKNRRTHSAHHVLYRYQVKLAVPTPTSKDIVNIIPGEYSYPFSFVVPMDALASFSNITTKIVHSAKAWVDVKFGMDADHAVPFVVKTFVPQRIRAEHGGPTETGQTFKLNGCCCCCCIDRGTLPMKVFTDKGFLVPGPGAEPLRVTVDIDPCGSKGKVQSVKAILQSIQIARAGGSTRYSTGNFGSYCFDSSTGKAVTTSEGIMRLQFEMPLNAHALDLTPNTYVGMTSELSWKLSVEVETEWSSSVTLLVPLIVSTAIDDTDKAPYGLPVLPKHDEIPLLLPTNPAVQLRPIPNHQPPNVTLAQPPIPISTTAPFGAATPFGAPPPPAFGAPPPAGGFAFDPAAPPAVPPGAVDFGKMDGV